MDLRKTDESYLYLPLSRPSVDSTLLARTEGDPTPLLPSSAKSSPVTPICPSWRTIGYDDLHDLICSLAIGVCSPASSHARASAGVHGVYAWSATTRSAYPEIASACAWCASVQVLRHVVREGFQPFSPDSDWHRRFRWRLALMPPRSSAQSMDAVSFSGVSLLLEPSRCLLPAPARQATEVDR